MVLKAITTPPVIGVFYLVGLTPVTIVELIGDCGKIEVFRVIRGFKALALMGLEWPLARGNVVRVRMV
jgi:hypothetical protein